MRFRAGPILIALLLAVPLGAAEAPIAFSTSGGDAWTFHKSIDIAVAEGRCDRVAIATPLRTIIAAPRTGHVSADIPLVPGDNHVEAQCLEPAGGRAEIAQQDWRVRLRNVPKAVIHTAEAGSDIVLDAGGSEPAPVQPSPILRYEWYAPDGNPAPLPDLPAEGKHLELSGAGPDGDYRVAVKVTDASGRSDASTILFRVRDGRPHVLDPIREHAGWINQAVIYGVVPQLFGPHGLADVTAHLDRLAALGVNTLWLSPLTASPPGDFGYAVTDYFRLRPEVGTADDLHELIRAAHARSMRVILDFVPNHLSEQHAYFADSAAHGRASAYFEFFARNKDGGSEHYFNWNNLKNLNYRNPEVQQLVIEAFAHWVREFDIDGFRVDGAWGPKERAPEFWPRWRAELKRIKPDLLLLAEASARDPYYGNNGFDAAYDWTDRLGEWAWQQAFSNQAHTASALRAAIAGSSGTSLTFRFLDNNDTGVRFVTRHGVDLAKLASAMLLTLPGIPGLYSGEEVGAAYEPYGPNHPIAWIDSYGLEEWYARLIALRRDQPALRSREIRMLDVAAADQVLAYVRPGETPERNIAVLLNFSPAPARISLDPGTLKLLGGQKLIDLLDRSEHMLDSEHSELLLESHAVRILQSEGAPGGSGTGRGVEN
jgi:glycosidase